MLALVCVAAGHSHGARARAFETVCYLNMVVGLDSSARAVSATQQKAMLQIVRRSLQSPYYELLPLPSSVTNSFSDVAMSLPRLTPEDVTKVTEQLLVPFILEVDREIASSGAKDDLQRSLIVRRKAESHGLSAAKYEALAKCSNLYVPYWAGYVVFETGKGETKRLTCQSRMGMLVYEFSRTRGGAKATLKERASTMAIGVAPVGRKGMAEARIKAFHQMAENGMNELTKSANEATGLGSLSEVAAVADHHAIFYVKDIDKLKVDDKFVVLGKARGASAARKKKTGWLVISNVFKQKEQQGYRIRGRVVGGKATKGSFVRKLNFLPLDITIGIKSFPAPVNYRLNADSLIVQGGATGYALSPNFNVGRFLGLNGLLVGFTLGHGLGEAAGRSSELSLTAEVEGVRVGYLALPVLTKTFRYWRATGYVQGGYAWQKCEFGFGGTPFSMQNGKSGLILGAGIGLPVATFASVEAGLLYQAMGSNSSWEYLRSGESYIPPAGNTYSAELSHSGIDLRVGVSFSVPRISFRKEGL